MAKFTNSLPLRKNPEPKPARRGHPSCLISMKHEKEWDKRGPGERLLGGTELRVFQTPQTLAIRVGQGTDTYWTIIHRPELEWECYDLPIQDPQD